MRVRWLGRRGAAIASCAGLAAASLACATGGTPAGAARPSGELTPDGLQRVQWGVFEHEFVKPGTHLAGYQKFLLDPVGLAYTKGDAPQRKIDPKDFEKLRSVFQEEVAAALAGSAYSLATAPGPDVLRVQAEAVDLKLDPPREGFGLDPDSTTWALSSEAALVVATLRDSESGEVLARIAQPERASSGQFERQDEVSFWSDVRELFRHWAILLRQMLDETRRH